MKERKGQEEGHLEENAILKRFEQFVGVEGSAQMI